MIVFSVVLIVGLILLYNALTKTRMVLPQTSVSGQAEQTAVEAGTPEEPIDVVTEEKPAEPVEFEIDFSFTDADGKSYMLSDFAGKPLVVNLWATWCGPCQMELPYFNMQCFNYADQVQFLMVDLVDGSYETIENTVAFVDSNGYSFPLFFTETDLYDITGQQYIPATLFIGADGKLVSMHIGSFSEPELVSEIEALIKR